MKIDKFFTGLGVNENSIKVIAEMDKKTKIYQLALAYIEGIIQYLEKGKTPIEFQLLELKKEKNTSKYLDEFNPKHISKNRLFVFSKQYEICLQNLFYFLQNL